MLARIGIVPDESDVIGRMYPSYISLASLLSVSCPSVFFVGSGLPLEPVFLAPVVATQSVSRLQ